jgi:Radical SAM superfamily
MHLAELLARRPVPGSAVFMALTRRCPLTCRHCSTTSTATAEQLPASLLRRFAETFTPADHPRYLLLTGGEPLLRPGLVLDLATICRAAGTRSYLLTGAFFAGRGRTPAPIQAAIDAVDHLAVSIDVFHESQVPRQAAFGVLREALAAGKDVSIQACGSGGGDPYTEDLASCVRREFGDRVPMLVTTLRPAGRARALLPVPGWPGPAGPRPAGPASGKAAGPARQRAAPCELVSWPVVGFDGTITACCNTDVLDRRPVPEHLRLGHVRSATWPQVRRLSARSPALRALRTRGPLQLAAGPGAGPAVTADYCGTCRGLAASQATLRRIERQAGGKAAELIEQQAIALQVRGGAAGFARRHGDPRLAKLVLLGHGEPAGAGP